MSKEVIIGGTSVSAVRKALNFLKELHSKKDASGISFYQKAKEGYVMNPSVKLAFKILTDFFWEDYHGSRMSENLTESASHLEEMKQMQENYIKESLPEMEKALEDLFPLHPNSNHDTD
ncbi:MAG: hypothetical protein JWM20_559 [Patescibacteria group bacterium]|nr:hypothetical protein [Patescibacteria group bacterium]